jgi:hypothetical protein
MRLLHFATAFRRQLLLLKRMAWAWVGRMGLLLNVVLFCYTDRLVDT